jgi:hypothetical protein
VGGVQVDVRKGRVYFDTWDDAAGAREGPRLLAAPQPSQPLKCKDRAYEVTQVRCIARFKSLWRQSGYGQLNVQDM